MKKTIVYIIALILSLSTIFFIFVSSIEIATLNRPIFSYHFDKSDIMSDTKMSHDDLMRSADKLIRYIKDKDDDLDITALVDGESREVFNEREKLHMIDVKNLYLAVRLVKRIALFLMLAILVLLRKNEIYGAVIKATLYVIPAISVLIVVLGGMFALDFNTNFVKFHLLFFDNDLWILNPNTDLLINMVPEAYFYGVIMLIVGLVISLIALFMYLYYNIYKRLKRR